MKGKLIFLVILSLTTSSLGKVLAPTPKKVPNNKDLSTAEDKDFKAPLDGYRIPKSFIPTHYEIRLRPILDNFPLVGRQWTAPGSVTVKGKCLEATNSITVHSEVNDVAVTSTMVTDLETNEPIILTKVTVNNNASFIIFELEKELAVGKEYSIFISFVADVKTDSLAGLYRSHYDDPNTGETKYLAATQFEAFEARKAFPCLDEPGFKATFKIFLGRRANYTALSNGAIITSVLDPEHEGWYWDEFEETVPMSTYLVAFLVSDFTAATASMDIYPKPVKTWGPKHLMDTGYGDYPSLVAAHVLQFYSEYFDINYALSKMDSAGLVDFAAGAMENWGLNLYRESALFYSPVQNNEKERRNVVLTLSHELAHQWSGNLLTCDWWDMTWLNEGFATYLSYKALASITPDFDPVESILNDCLQNAMRSDVLATRHPTVLPDDGTPWQIMEYNSNLVYSKGASLLRMMEGFLTTETMDKALQKYMKDFSYTGVVQDQFFQTVTDQAHEDGTLPSEVTIKQIMDTWTLQPGYPLVKVGADQTKLTLSQEEYRPDEGSDRTYFIPVAISSKTTPNLRDSKPTIWLTGKDAEVEGAITDGDWVVINSEATGYYRVEYTPDLAMKLQDQLVADHSAVSIGSRSQLLDDYFTFAFDGKASIEMALGFTKFLAKEGEGSVWNPVFFHLRKAKTLLPGTADFVATKTYMGHKLAGATKELTASGANVEKGAANLFLTQIMEWACAVDDVGCNTLSLVYFEQWKVSPNNNPVPPILRPTLYCTAIAKGINNENFKFALTQFVAASTDSSIKNQILTSLGCTNDPALVQTLLGAATGATPEIPVGFARAALIAVGANPNNRQKLLDFLDENYFLIVLNLGSARPVADVVASLSQYLSSNEDLIRVDDFKTKYGPAMQEEEQNIVEGAIKTIRENMEWMETFGTPMQKWFSENLS